MSNLDVDVKSFWVPQANRRGIITELLQAIKDTASSDSSESVALQNNLLEVYYPTLVKIAEKHFEEWRHPNVVVCHDAEDYVSAGFKAAIGCILLEHIDATIANFNGAVIASVRNKAMSNKSIAPSAEFSSSVAEALNAEIDETESPCFDGEVDEFFDAFVQALKPKPNGTRSAPMQADEVDFDIINDRFLGGASFEEIGAKNRLTRQAAQVREVLIRDDARGFLKENSGEFPIMHGWLERVEAQKAEKLACNEL